MHLESYRLIDEANVCPINEHLRISRSLISNSGILYAEAMQGLSQNSAFGIFSDPRSPPHLELTSSNDILTATKRPSHGSNDFNSTISKAAEIGFFAHERLSDGFQT